MQITPSNTTPIAPPKVGFSDERIAGIADRIKDLTSRALSAAEAVTRSTSDTIPGWFAFQGVRHAEGAINLFTYASNDKGFAPYAGVREQLTEGLSYLHRATEVADAAPVQGQAEMVKYFSGRAAEFFGNAIQLVSR
ncbi:MAG: hypothetical protein JWM90_2594 [Thermoleophilia bacterium]|nr:hypothetical protein [Thermoleophilia bacterium]